MAVQVMKPIKEMVQTQEASNDGSKWGAILGALAAGAAIVGTGGAAAPAVLAAAGSGASLGGLVGGVFNKDAKYGTKTSAQAPQAQQTDSSAIARRAQEKSQNELAALTKAEQSLDLVDPEIANEYAEPIKKAKALAQQKYGVA